MTRHIAALRQIAIAYTLGVTIAACGGDLSVEPGSVVGTFGATIFRVTPSGKPQIDVLAQGGSLSISVTAKNVTTGQLSLPASVAGSAVLAPMTGEAIITGNTVRFQQTADTFVRDLTWSVGRDTLQVSNQSVGSATYTITLVKR